MEAGHFTESQAAIVGAPGGLVKIPNSWGSKHDLNGDFTNDEWIFFGIFGWIEWIEPTIWPYDAQKGF